MAAWDRMRVQLSFEIYFVIYDHFSLSFLPSFSLQRKRKIYTYRTYRERKVGCGHPNFTASNGDGQGNV